MAAILSRPQCVKAIKWNKLWSACIILLYVRILFIVIIYGRLLVKYIWIMCFVTEKNDAGYCCCQQISYWTTFKELILLKCNDINTHLICRLMLRIYNMEILLCSGHISRNISNKPLACTICKNMNQVNLLCVFMEFSSGIKYWNLEWIQ